MNEMTPTSATTPSAVPNLTYETTIACTPQIAHFLQELLWVLPGVEAVMENYAPGSSDQTVLEDLSSIKVFSQDVSLSERVAVLLESDDALKAAGCRIKAVKEIREADWFESWKAHWHITPITEHLVICPTWEKHLYEPKSPEEQVLYLDPGSAFGTGAHETTRLMLEALERLSAERDFSQVSILDVGTGSGILAIYAAKLGCRSVMGVDNDSNAVEQARLNAERNGVQLSMNDTPLGELCMTKYDMILANIIAPVILDLFDEMIARLEPGGVLIASGLIESSVGEVEARMREAGFDAFERCQQGDWFSLKGVYSA